MKRRTARVSKDPPQGVSANLGQDNLWGTDLGKDVRDELSFSGMLLSVSCVEHPSAD